ncbi:MAG: dihydrodipicolinate synthase family protein, partial [Thermomicrobiales bacterium]
MTMVSSRPRGALADLAGAFRGVTVTIVTPFLPDSLDVDCAGMRRNVDALAASGVAVIVPAGNTGEYHSLTAEEVRTTAELTIKEVAGRTPVAVGVGGDLRTAIALAQDAQRFGAAGILLHEPHHTFVTDDGLYRYYADICRAIDVGVAIYKRTPRLDDRIMLRVARDCENVVAIKYAWNDAASYVRLVQEAPDRITCACGSAERWALPFSAAGTTGFTSGIANFAPALPLAFWRALQSRDATLLPLWQQLAQIEDLRAANASAFNVPVVKYAMDVLGLAAGPVRPPL